MNLETKVVLKYFYSKRVVVADDHDLDWHLDHLVPVAWWKKVKEHFVNWQGAPFNSIGNIALMTAEDNASKSDAVPIRWKIARETSLDEGKAREFLARCDNQYLLIEDSYFAYASQEDPGADHLAADLEAPTLILDGLLEQSKKRWEIIRNQILQR